MSLTKSATNAHKRTSGHALLCANSFTCGRPFQNQAIGNWNIKMIGIPMFGAEALYLNGQPSHVTLPFKYWTPKVYGILVFRVSGIQMVTKFNISFSAFSST